MSANTSPGWGTDTCTPSALAICRLLRQGELTTDDIAKQSVYARTAAFAKAFKKETGQTPGKVRRRARPNHSPMS